MLESSLRRATVARVVVCIAARNQIFDSYLLLKLRVLPLHAKFPSKSPCRLQSCHAQELCSTLETKPSRKATACTCSTKDRRSIDGSGSANRQGPAAGHTTKPADRCTRGRQFSVDSQLQSQAASHIQNCGLRSEKQPSFCFIALEVRLMWEFNPTFPTNFQVGYFRNGRLNTSILNRTLISTDILCSEVHIHYILSPKLNKSLFIPVHDWFTRHWYSLPDMPGPKSYCQAVQLNHWLVVLGGRGTSGDRCRKVFAFNTRSRVWAQWHETPYASCAAASTGHHLYVAGGCPPEGGKAVGDVYKLNDCHDAWKVISTLPRPCCVCAATTLNGKLYVVGGVDEDRARYSYLPSATTSVQVLDLQINTWSEITMSSSDHRFQGTMITKRVITLGHLLITDWLTTYDVATKKSRDLPLLPETSDSKRHSGMAVVNDRLLVWQFNTRKVHILSEDHARWFSLPDICKDHNNGALCTVDSRVYAIGGRRDASHEPVSSFECFE